MDIVLPRYKHKVSLSLTVSLIIHGLFFWFVFSAQTKYERIKELIRIDAVEFIEETKQPKPKSTLDLLKMAIPKATQLPAIPEPPPKMEEKLQELEQKPLLQDKKAPLELEKKQLPLTKKLPDVPRLSEDKMLDLTKIQPAQREVKDLAMQDIIVDKDSPILKAEDVTPLINLAEVGETAVSQKVLDVLKQVEEKRQVIKEYSTEEKLTDKQLENLEKKFAEMPGQAVIAMSDKTLNRIKTIDVPTTKTERQPGARWAEEPAQIQDLKQYTQQERRSFDIGDEARGQANTEKNMAMVEAPKQEKPKPKLQPSQRFDNLKMLKQQENRVLAEEQLREKKQEAVEITGPLKDRQTIFNPIPDYPAWAKARGIEANVTLYFVVEPGGRVIGETISVERTSGYIELDNLVIGKLKLWRFVPLNASEKQINQEGLITFRFRLT